MKHLRGNKQIKYFLIGLSVLIFVYILLRALYIDITIDEASTIVEYVPMSLKEIMFSVTSVNNHILNTLAIKFLLHFHNTPTLFHFISRIPNILAFILYGFSIYKLLEKQNNLIRITSSIILLVNPFILEFFAYARGYGLSFGLLAFSFYILQEKRFAVKVRDVTSVIFFGLAVYSNLTLIYGLVPFLLYVLLKNFNFKQLSFSFKSIVSAKLEYLKSNILLISIISIVSVFVLQRLYTAVQSDSLFYGLTGGYVEVIISVLKAFTYDNIFNINVFIFGLIIFTLSFVYWIYRSVKKKKVDSNALLYALIIIIAPIEMILAYTLLDTLYPVARTSYWLLLPTILFLGSIIKLDKISKVLVITTLILFSFATIFSAIGNLRLSESYYWQWDINSKKTSDILEVLDNSNPGEDLVAVDWLLKRSIKLNRDVSGYSYSVVSLDIKRLPENSARYLVTLDHREDFYSEEGMGYIRANYIEVYRFNNNGVIVWEVR